MQRNNTSHNLFESKKKENKVVSIYKDIKVSFSFYHHGRLWGLCRWSGMFSIIVNVVTHPIVYSCDGIVLVKMPYPKQFPAKTDIKFWQGPNGTGEKSHKFLRCKETKIVANPSNAMVCELCKEYISNTYQHWNEQCEKGKIMKMIASKVREAFLYLKNRATEYPDVFDSPQHLYVPGALMIEYLVNDLGVTMHLFQQNKMNNTATALTTIKGSGGKCLFDYMYEAEKLHQKLMEEKEAKMASAQKAIVTDESGKVCIEEEETTDHCVDLYMQDPKGELAIYWQTHPDIKNVVLPVWTPEEQDDMEKNCQHLVQEYQHLICMTKEAGIIREKLVKAKKDERTKYLVKAAKVWSKDKEQKKAYEDWKESSNEKAMFLWQNQELPVGLRQAAETANEGKKWPAAVKLPKPFAYLKEETLVESAQMYATKTPKKTKRSRQQMINEKVMGTEDSD